MNSAVATRYTDTLKPEAKARYLEKTSILEGIDPYEIVSGADFVTTCEFPPVESSDIVSYLVLQTSFISAQQFKARKSLEAFNQFISGWIKDVKAWKIHGKCVVTGKVRHSQKSNDPPLSCWIIVEPTGEVCCAHCTCMAGLNEVCTHVAAVLFYLEAAARINGQTTVTQQKCQWAIPAFQKKIPYLKVEDIDFYSAKGKRRKLSNIDEESNVPGLSPTPESSSEKDVSTPSSSEVAVFCSKLSHCGTKPALLSLLPEYASHYIPSQQTSAFPRPLQDLFEPQFLQLDYANLCKHAETIKLEVTSQNVTTVEQATRGQSTSKMWFKYRSGRITASKMKRVCRTDSSSPSQRLLKEVCYPEVFRFTAPATQWGLKQEKQARAVYGEYASKRHDDFTISNSGLFLNSKWVFLGESPDGLVSCSCCGNGVLEVKCPYTLRHSTIENYAKDPNSCLSVLKETGDVQLDRDHEYFFQVQTQMYVCEVDYCDFVVCTFPPDVMPQISVIRILPDLVFWDSCVDASLAFFKSGVLPELLGRWFTRGQRIRDRQHTESKYEDSATAKNTPAPLFCYCQQPEDFQREMIGCDNPQCKIEWFHTECLKLSSVPDGLWFCPDCTEPKPST